ALWPKSRPPAVVPPPPPVASDGLEAPVAVAPAPDPAPPPSPSPAPPPAAFQRPRARLEAKARLSPALLRVVAHHCAASVFVDGKLIGVTPLPQALPLTAGEHRVKLSNPNCKPPLLERTVMLRSGD